MPNRDDEEYPHGALTYTARRITDLFTGDRDTNGGVPSVYTELQEAIERQLGQKLALSPRFVTFKSWTKALTN